MKTILIYCRNRENLSKEKCLRTVVKLARGVPAFRVGRIKTGSPVTGLRFSVYRGTGLLLLCDLVEPLDLVPGTSTLQKTLRRHWTPIFWVRAMLRLAQRGGCPRFSPRFEVIFSTCFSNFFLYI